MSGRLDDRAARAALARVLEPGSWRTWRAVEAHGAVEIWERLCRGAVPELTDQAVAGARTRMERWRPAEDAEKLARCGGRVVVPGEEEWPAEALTWGRAEGADGVRGLLDAPPLALHVRGPHDLAAATEKAVAVVGARAATAYGEHVATELSGHLSRAGFAVVSGGAYGIDGAAHRGALLAGEAPTVAVLACGVDVAYPRGNDQLLGRIAARGLVVSELPCGSAPTRGRFLVRNRLIAALSLGTVVVEAALRSGSLATADRARGLGRHVMAVPGPVTSAASAGCHALLRGTATVPRALLVATSAHVLSQVGSLLEHPETDERGASHPRDELSAVVRSVLDAVPVQAGAGPASIARTAGVSVLVVQQVLPPLLAAGLVERHPDGWRLTTLGAGSPAR